MSSGGRSSASQALRVFLGPVSACGANGDVPLTRGGTPSARRQPRARDSEDVSSTPWQPGADFRVCFRINGIHDRSHIQIIATERRESPKICPRGSPRLQNWPDSACMSLPCTRQRARSGARPTPAARAVSDTLVMRPRADAQLHALRGGCAPGVDLRVNRAAARSLRKACAAPRPPPCAPLRGLDAR